MSAAVTTPVRPRSGRWEGSVVGASLAAICGGAALMGRWPLFATVLVIQLAVMLAWLALMSVPPSSAGVTIIAGAAVAADIYASRLQPPDQAPVAIVIASAFVLAMLRQLARRHRSRATESLAAVMAGVVIVVLASHLLATRSDPGGVGSVAATCFAVAAATAIRGGVDAVLARPRLRAGTSRAWPGLLLSLVAGAGAGAYVGAERAGLDARTGALIGLGAALAAAVADIGIELGSLRLDGDRRSAIRPLVVLLPLVVAAPVGYDVARLLAR